MLHSKKIAVITEEHNDILNLIEKNKIQAEVFKPGSINYESLDSFYAIAILGGASEKPIMLHPRERVLIEEQIKKGKKVFAEYCASIGHVYCENPSSTRFERLVFCSDEKNIEGLEYGDVLDDQCGMRIKPYPEFCSHSTPILQFTTGHAHNRISDLNEMKENVKKEIKNRALWFEDTGNVLICSFKLSNFHRARYAPKLKIKQVIKFILEWLTDIQVDVNNLSEYYTTGLYDSKKSLDSQLSFSIEKAMSWFEKSGILLNNGKDGVLEGLGTEIYPDGRQQINSILRTDCIGETSLAYLMYSLMNEDAGSMVVSDNLAYICFKYMVSKDEGPMYGMMRWTQQAWGVCYQDDVARAIIPQMLKCLYTGSKDYLNDCMDILRFLVKTTGTDGTRVFRTDNINLNEDSINKLCTTPGNLPSSHYNGYYYAALLLAYKLTDAEEFKNMAVKGITTLMEAYPNTKREQSQTEEYCRLILPLSWLYWVTKSQEHKDWLYKVADDLQKYKHPSGSYLEWDEGYKASMRHTGGDGECSLLSENGDPVVDLLYSNNWLPIGFIQAYLVTGDIYFKKLWEETSVFMINAQIHSNDDKINGAWARGFDVELMEVFGSPADAGWGPWAIESGWTMAEITSGLIMGLLEDKLKRFYRLDNYDN